MNISQNLDLAREQAICQSSINREFHADQGSGIIKEITPSEAYDLIHSMNDVKAEPTGSEQCSLVILDVRTPTECSAGRIEGSIILDFRSPSFQDQLSALDPKKAYLVYCRTGRRSAKTVSLMNNLGFKELYNLIGGIVNWHNEGFEIV